MSPSPLLALQWEQKNINIITNMAAGDVERLFEVAGVNPSEFEINPFGKIVQTATSTLYSIQKKARIPLGKGRFKYDQKRIGESAEERGIGDHHLNDES